MAFTTLSEWNFEKCSFLEQFHYSIHYYKNQYKYVPKKNRNIYIKMLKWNKGGIKMFSEKLKEARKNKNLSQEQVAEILNIARSNISKYENGNLEPTIQTLKEFCKLYEVSADYLLELNNSKTKNNISIHQENNTTATININNK